MSHDAIGEARILGIPTQDGAYWYYEQGKPWPTVVQACTHRGQRAIRKSDGAFQHYWLAGEFFVGPLVPPMATPAGLANPTAEAFKMARENMRFSDGRMGIDGSGRWHLPDPIAIEQQP